MSVGRNKCVWGRGGGIRKVVKVRFEGEGGDEGDEEEEDEKEMAAITRGNEVWLGKPNAVLHTFYGKGGLLYNERMNKSVCERGRKRERRFAYL